MDGQLRQLRARFVASNSDEDKAAYLRARVRAGEQDEEGLRVGVWLGDEVAREVGAELLGDEAVTLVASKSGVVKLLEGLPGGPEVQTRALRAAWRTTAAVCEPEPAHRAAIEAIVACDEPPTPEQVARAREARAAIGPAASAGGAMLLVLGIERLEALVTEGWDGRRHVLARNGLIYSLGRHARAGEVRAAVIAALLPWVYLRSAAPAARPAEGAPAEQGHEPNVFSAVAMTPAAARAVLELAPAKRPTKLEARALVETYLRALGWEHKVPRRASSTLSFVHPDGQSRIQLTERVLRLEVGGPGAWRRPADNAGRQSGLIDVAQRLIEAARWRA